MSNDAIVILKDDHREIRQAFTAFERADDAAEKQELVDRIIELLTVHTYLENVRHHIEEEEDPWFPKVREALGRTAPRRSARRCCRRGRRRRPGPRSPAR